MRPIFLIALEDIDSRTGSYLARRREAICAVKTDSTIMRYILRPDGSLEEFFGFANKRGYKQITYKHYSVAGVNDRAWALAKRPSEWGLSNNG